MKRRFHISQKLSTHPRPTLVIFFFDGKSRDLLGSDIRVQVTRYVDDKTVRGARYTTREIGPSMSLSRIQWGCTCILVMIVIIVGVIVLGVVVFVVIVIEKRL